MPLIDFTLPAGALEPHALDGAMAQMTEALLRHEGATDNEATRAMSRGVVHEIPPGRIYVGGEPADRPTYRAVLRAPEGTLLHGPGPVGRASREALVREVTEIVLAAEGTEPTPAESGRVFCLIAEVKNGHWGGMGTIFSIEDIVALANPEAPQTQAAEEARDALAPV